MKLFCFFTVAWYRYFNVPSNKGNLKGHWSIDCLIDLVIYELIIVKTFLLANGVSRTSFLFIAATSYSRCRREWRWHLHSRKFGRYNPSSILAIFVRVSSTVFTLSLRWPSIKSLCFRSYRISLPSNMEDFLPCHSGRLLWKAYSKINHSQLFCVWWDVCTVEHSSPMAFTSMYSYVHERQEQEPPPLKKMKKSPRGEGRKERGGCTRASIDYVTAYRTLKYRNKLNICSFCTRVGVWCKVSKGFLDTSRTLAWLILIHCSIVALQEAYLPPVLQTTREMKATGSDNVSPPQLTRRKTYGSTQNDHVIDASQLTPSSETVLTFTDEDRH